MFKASSTGIACKFPRFFSTLLQRAATAQRSAHRVLAYASTLCADPHRLLFRDDVIQQLEVHSITASITILLLSSVCFMSETSCTEALHKYQRVSFSIGCLYLCKNEISVMQKNVSRSRFEIEFNVFNAFKKTSIANLVPASLI